MKTRDKGYADYGLTKNQVEAAQEFCKRYRHRGENETGYQAIVQAAKEANPELYRQLILSLIYDLSYERISGMEYIPIDKGSFYGYRRKAIYKVYTKTVKDLHRIGRE